MSHEDILEYMEDLYNRGISTGQWVAITARGVKDLLICSIDNLSGFGDTIGRSNSRCGVSPGRWSVVPGSSGPDK